MKNLKTRVIEVLTSSKVQATKTAIKGKMSSGQEDSFSNDKNWKAA